MCDRLAKNNNTVLQPEKFTLHRKPGRNVTLWMDKTNHLTLTLEAEVCVPLPSDSQCWLLF